MKTTLNLPDELMRAVKLRAVRENRTMQDLIAELLRRGLLEDASAADVRRRRVQFPLVSCVHDALPHQEMTPEKVAQALMDEEAGDVHGRPWGDLIVAQQPVEDRFSDPFKDPLFGVVEGALGERKLSPSITKR